MPISLLSILDKRGKYSCITGFVVPKVDPDMLRPYSGPNSQVYQPKYPLFLHHINGNYIRFIEIHLQASGVCKNV
jgi:hypothetical protein